MGHVPDHNLTRYRKLKVIADSFERAGDYLGSEFMEDANKAYALSAKYREVAQKLRTTGRENDCTYTFAHTKHWCGHEGCRDS